MKKRKKKMARRVVTYTAEVKATWHVIVIDDAPLRARALKAYNSAETEFAQTQEQLEAFETGDKPAYYRWEAQVLGAELTALREVENAIRAKFRILDAIEAEVFWSGCSRATAYHRVMEAEKNGPDPDDWDPFGDDGDVDFDQDDFDEIPLLFGDSNLPEGFDIRDYDQWREKRKKQFRHDYEATARAFSFMTGLPAPNLDEELAKARAAAGISNHEADGAPASSKAQPPPDPTETRIKSLYRDLARKLHPDYNGKQGWRERELWHEVQEAYAAKDLERLQGLSARVEIAQHGASMSMPVSLLTRMATDLRNKLGSLRVMLRNAKKHPAWEFSKAGPKLAELEKIHRREIQSKRQKLDADLADATEMLDEIAAASNKRKFKSKPKAAAKPKTAKNKASPPPPKPQTAEEFFQAELF